LFQCVRDLHFNINFGGEEFPWLQILGLEG
jgi:hypothetical protein